jgi:predicted HAD superfamily Cof-like phosphohydrolase
MTEPTYDIAEAVRALNKAFKHPAPVRVTHVDEETAQLRYDLIEEEARELGEAYWRYPDRGWGAKAKYAPNLTEVFDACLDQIIVAVGTMVVHGFSNKQIYAGLKEVVRSNMTKLDREGNPIYKPNGKYTKSDQYEEPDLKPIIGRLAL